MPNFSRLWNNENEIEVKSRHLFDGDDDFDGKYGIYEDGKDEEDGGDERGPETIESNLQVW